MSERKSPASDRSSGTVVLRPRCSSPSPRTRARKPWTQLRQLHSAIITVIRETTAPRHTKK